MFSIYILWLFIFLLIALLLKFLDIKKNYIICFLISIFIILFVINLESSITAAMNGAKLAFKAILPTIFPFTVICNLLICYDGITLYSKILGPLICKPLGLSNNCSFPIVASFICGYPLGAKYASDIYNLGFIHKKEYERLLNIASNAGPIFILGSISVAMLNNVVYGYILLIANYLSIIIIGLITRRGTHYNTMPDKNIKFENKPFGANLKFAIEGAINTTLNISAFVILFSVIISIIKSNTLISAAFLNLSNYSYIASEILYTLLLGSIEFTNGAKIIASTNIVISLKLSLISFILCFSSLSIIAQVASFISKDNPNFKKYIFLKFIQGILGFIITFISSNVILNSITTFNNNYSYNSNIVTYKTFITILIILTTTLIFTIIVKKLKVKLHSS
ncbi:sporulation integral membrane protein YlbJ [Clostridium tertium]|uniref:Sporulation integral membrane protein YlbJ n=1 Tax=Clostridium tertium TaxID=1559 RepID=A0A6N2Z6R5_9CLOT